MVALKQRMISLGMTPSALVRRAKLPAETVDRVLSESPDITSDDLKRVRLCLGVGKDGHRLVSNRTFRKQAARKKARFVLSMVQGTMGLEAQGLDPAGYRTLHDQTYRRLLKAKSAQLW